MGQIDNASAEQLAVNYMANINVLSGDKWAVHAYD